MWKGNEGGAGGAEIQGADEGGVYYWDVDGESSDVEGADNESAEEGALPPALEVGSMISTSSSLGWEKFRLNIAGKSGLTSFSVTKWLWNWEHRRFSWYWFKSSILWHVLISLRMFVNVDLKRVPFWLRNRSSLCRQSLCCSLLSLELVDTSCNWCKKVSVAGWAWFCCDVLGMVMWCWLDLFICRDLPIKRTCILLKSFGWHCALMFSQGWLCVLELVEGGKRRAGFLR